MDDSAKNVQVYVRIRPPNARELEFGYRPCLELDERNGTVTVNTKPEPKTFTYDHVAGGDSAQVQ